MNPCGTEVDCRNEEDGCQEVAWERIAGCWRSVDAMLAFELATIDSKWGGREIGSLTLPPLVRSRLETLGPWIWKASIRQLFSHSQKLISLRGWGKQCERHLLDAMLAVRPEMTDEDLVEEIESCGLGSFEKGQYPQRLTISITLPALKVAHGRIRLDHHFRRLLVEVLRAGARVAYLHELKNRAGGPINAWHERQMALALLAGETPSDEVMRRAKSVVEGNYFGERHPDGLKLTEMAVTRALGIPDEHLGLRVGRQSGPDAHLELVWPGWSATKEWSGPSPDSNSKEQQ